MIIDVHVHPVAKSMIKDHRNLKFMKRHADLLCETPIETLLAKMDSAGISKSCLLGPNHLDGISLSNEEVHELVQKHPDRFVGFVGVDPQRQGNLTTRALIEQAVDIWKFRGIGEFGGGDFLTSDWDIVYEVAMEKNIPVLVHTGIPLPSMKLRYSHPTMIDRLATKFPNLKIIAAHIGAPWFFKTIEIAAKHPNVYIDISAVPKFKLPIIPILLAICIKRGVEDRILFGSDFPVVDPARYAASVDRMQIPALLTLVRTMPPITDAIKRKILGGNAEKLLGLSY